MPRVVLLLLLLLGGPAWSADVEFFTRAGCPHCDEAHRFLELLAAERPGLSVEARRVDVDAEARARLEEIVAQVRKKDVSLEKSLDLLEEGVRTFPRRSELVYRTAELNVRHGFTDTARWLITLGLTLAPDGFYS
jgi:glutaredoxin